MSKPSPQHRQLDLEVSSEDNGAVRVLIEAHPELLHERNYLNGDTWLTMAARRGNLELVQFFFERGISVNALSPGSNGGSCALAAAVGENHVKVARWLLDHGADPTISDTPLIDAAYAGNVEFLKLFVERGCRFNFVFGIHPPRTPLSLALRCGRTEAAEYLRSIGAVMPPAEDLPPAVSCHDELAAHLVKQTGGVLEPLGMQEILPGVVSVSVHTILTPTHQLLFSSGLSSRPMTVPSGQEEFQYAELVMFLPPDWPKLPALDGPHAWPLKWLRLIAHYPHEYQTWLGAPFTTFTNDDPPRFLAEGCPFNSFLLTYGQHFPPFTNSDGRRINLITAIPLYPEELAIAKKPTYGFVELYSRFEKHRVHPGDKYPRPNVAI